MKVAFALFLMISCTVGGNLLLKMGAVAPPAQRVVLGLLAWQTCAGIFVFGCSLLSYMWVLRVLPLNVAQSFTALQFVCVTLASSLVLAERIPPARWLGFGMVLLGIVVVSLTTD